MVVFSRGNSNNNVLSSFRGAACLVVAIATLDTVSASYIRCYSQAGCQGTVLEEGQGYRIKRIEINPGHWISLQMHHHRSEHWIVVSGTAKATCGEQEVLLYMNQSTYVPACIPHRLGNAGVIPLVVIEVQNGEYLGEDDIIRFQDDQAFLQNR